MIIGSPAYAALVSFGLCSSFHPMMPAKYRSHPHTENRPGDGSRLPLQGAGEGGAIFIATEMDGADQRRLYVEKVFVTEIRNLQRAMICTFRRLATRSGHFPMPQAIH